MKILVTGGCGFIGTNFIRHIFVNLLNRSDSIVNIDKQTYAGQGKNLEHIGLASHPNYSFVRGDICERSLVDRVFSEHKPDMVINFAAESHVDRSIEGSEDFVMSNVLGAANIFDASKKFGVGRIIQVSTDEVYGSIREGSFSEEDKLNPSSPYSASKAAAEHLAFSYFRTHKLPVIVTRSANNYGPYQFPEKILPLFITNLIDGKKVPLMWTPENPALNVRDWLHVEDNCRAIWTVAMCGKEGEAYNIPGENERTNMTVTEDLLDCFGRGEDAIEKIPHRKGHDFRYSITGNKLRELGFAYRHNDFDTELAQTVDWYKNNQDWWRPLKK